MKYLIISVVSIATWCTTAYAQMEEDRLIYGIEFKGHVRDSDAAKFPIPFPFPPEFLPEGETNGFLETVDPGSTAEISRISFFLEGQLTRIMRGRIKIDTIDKYDRNPTSGDNKIDVDEAWLRFGRDYRPDQVPTQGGWYVTVGKFGKFERQDDRHLESYGVLSTSYNRFEDAGLEIGVDIGRNFYIKGSYTNGNPLFMRDFHSLAGDNGIDETNPVTNPFPDPDLKTGFVSLYDAEVEDFDFEEPEVGLALGYRFGNEFGSKVANFMIYRYKRDLQETVDITGSFYGGDLDLLLGVSEELGLPIALPLDGNDKEETGLNIWLYLEAFTLFGQAIQNETAGLESDGFEVEMSYFFELPVTAGIGGKPLFPFITPALRYSRLSHDFSGNAAIFPAPSLWWDWEKLDLGFLVNIYQGLDLTLEYSRLEFKRLGVWENADEALATFTYRWLKRKEARP